MGTSRRSFVPFLSRVQLSSVYAVCPLPTDAGSAKEVSQDGLEDPSLCASGRGGAGSIDAERSETGLDGVLQACVNDIARIVRDSAMSFAEPLAFSI